MTRRWLAIHEACAEKRYMELRLLATWDCEAARQQGSKIARLVEE